MRGQVPPPRRIWQCRRAGEWCFGKTGKPTRCKRQALGIPDGFVRVSLGVEDVEDIIADFEHALAA